MTSQDLGLKSIALRLLKPHPMNPNYMPPELKEKLRAHIAASGRYEPLIVRPLPGGEFQSVSGHQRADVLAELGEEFAFCCVWDIDEEETLILLATLNRLRGEDIPGKRAALIEALQEHNTLAELAKLLPESEAELESTLSLLDMDVDGLIDRLTAAAAQASAENPRVFTFAVDPGDAPVVDSALERARQGLTGKNQNGRALVALARRFIEDE